MTIITKARFDKKAEKPLVVNDGAGTECVERGYYVSSDSGTPDVETWLSSSARRRVSTTTTVCVFLTALLVMTIGIIGGVYLYRQFTQLQRMSRFRGWCGIPYERDTLHFTESDKLLGPNKPFFKESTAEWLPPRPLFKEEFDLDLDSDMFGSVKVPEFGYGRYGEFLHDFMRNKTCIIDLSSGHCFVMPLDREHVKQPRSLFDIIRRMWTGYYNIDTKVIRKNMKVVYPAIEDLSTQGKYIAKQCENYPTYLLEEIDTDDSRIRRSACKDCEFTLAEFAGNGILEYTISGVKQH